MVQLSVIMSVFNEKVDWIKESVESILNQTYSDFEFIIVIDNPNNKDICECLDKYQRSDSRIQIIENDKNIGLTNSLNRALKFCKGKYIARMDADDISYLNRFKKQVKILEENNNLDLISSKIMIINEEGKELFETNCYGSSYVNAKNALMYRNIFAHPTWMFRRTILEKLKIYENIPKAEDYDFMCRLFLNGYKAKVVEETLLKYRIRKNGVSNSNLFFQNLVADLIRKDYKRAMRKNNIKVYNPDYKLILHYLTEDKKEKYSKAISIYEQGKAYARSRRYFKAIICISKSCMISNNIFNQMYITIRLKKYK